VKELKAVIGRFENPKTIKRAGTAVKRAGSAVKRKPSGGITTSGNNYHASQTQGNSFLNHSNNNASYTPQQLHVLEELSHQAQKNQKQIL
jgi:hypothetical protein